MKTLTSRFNKALKQLKEDIIINEDSRTDWDGLELEEIVEILEPSCNLNFVNVLFRITKEGKILTRHFEDDQEFMINDFRDVITKFDKEKLCEMVENFAKN